MTPLPKNGIKHMECGQARVLGMKQSDKNQQLKKEVNNDVLNEELAHYKCMAT